MSAKKLTEGAVLLAIYAILLLIFLYLPVIGTLFSLALPLPFIYYVGKYNWKDGSIFFIASLVIGFIVGNIPSLFVTLLYGITGSVLGVCLYYAKDRRLTFLFGTLAYILVTLLLLALSLILFDINFINEIATTLREMARESLAIFEALGQEIPPEAQDMLFQMISIGLDLIPTILVLISAIQVWLAMMISVPVMKRLGISVPAGQPFREISFPRSLIWYFLIVSILSFIVPLQQGDFLSTVILNFLSLFQIIFSIQGISFMFFFAHRKNLSNTIPIVVTVITVLNPLLLQIVQLLGIIDLGFDLRKRLET